LPSEIGPKAAKRRTPKIEKHSRASCINASR
jgi:hypothetical protein